jgi:hypothetical protein
MKRRSFIKNVFGVSLGAFTLGQREYGLRKEEKSLLSSITRANDQNTGPLLQNYNQMIASSGGRALTGFLLSVSAAYCAVNSVYYHDHDVIAPMLEVTKELKKRQNPDGTFNFGNLQSPPDSGFMAEQFFRAQALLIKDGSSETELLRENLKELMLKTAEALVTGGVHTPNHRWVICAALAGTNVIYPDQRYTDRIHDWLDEGIGQDPDGQHPERSPNYDASVNNPSLIDVAICMNRPDLFEPVRKNLEMTMYLLEPNGEVDTTASRRQDAGRVFMIHRFYLPFRYMAIKDQNPQFAAVTRMIESKFKAHLGGSLADFMLHENLTESLPEGETVPQNYTCHLKHSHLVRIRRDRTTAAVFGGTDWHKGFGVWSGLSHNPAFFKFRKGDAILESVRMSPVFFRTGYFRSEGLVADGNSYHLSEERQTPYHQPLPRDFRREDGVYKMSADGRFFSKMDFENRPKDYIKLKSELIIRELNNSGAFELDISVGQTPGVAVTVELCFRKGGELSGVIPNENDPDVYFLKEGTGTYRSGNDVIEFGPGSMEHRQLPQANEQYAVHNGDIVSEGYRVLITFRTPFTHTLKIA